MKIYSGKCCLCDCGIETNLVDNSYKKLKTGDIVAVASRHADGEFTFIFGLSVVVLNQYETFSDGTIKTNPGNHEPFVMGLANVDINNDETWLVQKVKDFEDVLDGEHWKDFGFYFKKQ